MDCSPPGSSVLGILQARILEWVPIPFSRGSSQSRDWTWVSFHTGYLTYIQTTSCKILGWMNHKLESRLPGEISITSDRQMMHPHGRKWRGTKEPSDEGERGEREKWNKIQKTKIMVSGPITLWQRDGEEMETDSKITAAMKWNTLLRTPKDEPQTGRNYFQNTY